MTLDTGFSPASARVTACRLLKANAAVQDAVRQEQAKVAARIEIDRERVIAELQDAIDIARFRSDSMAMIAGWREIARLCGFYTPQPGTGRHTIRRRVVHDEHLAALSDAQLEELLRA